MEKSEKELSDARKKYLKAHEEFRETVKDIAENGTLEQKIDLLVSDYQRRLCKEEIRLRSEIRNTELLLTACCAFGMERL